MNSRRQVIYVNSALRTLGTPSDFRVTLGNGSLHASRGFRTRVAVGEATINRSWFNVKPDHNYILLDNVPKELPVGNYNAIDLRIALSRALPVGWVVSYDRLASRFSITRPDDAEFGYAIAFKSLGNILGFTDNTVVVLTPPNPTAVSTFPARVSGENAVLVHSDMSKSGGSALDNFANIDAFNDSSIIAKIPIDVAPYDNLIFRVQNDLEFFDVPFGHTDAVRFWLTDERNVPLVSQFDWTMTLVVSHEPDDSMDMLETLKEARDLLKLQVLSKKSVLR